MIVTAQNQHLKSLWYNSSSSSLLSPSILFPPVRGLGEHCKLPQQGMGQSPRQNWIWWIFYLQIWLCWQQFWWHNAFLMRKSWQYLVQITGRIIADIGWPHVTLAGLSEPIRMGFHLVQTTRDPGEQLRLGRAAWSSLSHPSPFPFPFVPSFLLPLFFPLCFPLNAGTGSEGML